MTGLIRHSWRDVPTYGKIREFAWHLHNGGVLVAPDRGCYGVFGDPTDPRVVKLIRDLTGNPSAPLPLTVGSVRQANKLVEMGDQDERYLADQWPAQPLTWVAKARARHAALSRRLGSTEGTIGVQVTDNPLQQMLTIERNSPIISTAIYNPDRTPVRNGDVAMEMIEYALDRVGYGSVAITTNDKWRFGTYSTVLKMDENRRDVMTIREGEVPTKTVRRLKWIMSPTAVEDIT